MKNLVEILTFLLLIIISKISISKSNSICPTWMLAANSSIAPNNCLCGADLRKVVRCSEATERVEILLCHGITYSSNYNTSVVSDMIYTCTTGSYQSYYEVPTNISEQGLTNFSCARFNREGQMCGNCVSGYTPPIYSYTLNCTKCDSFKWSSLAYYVSIAYLPVIVFYVLVLIFRFKANSPVIFELILLCQLVSSSINITFARTDLFNEKTKGLPRQLYYQYFVFILSGIWNLDFGRIYHKPFCLHPSLGIQQVIALDYLIAACPLFLILVTFYLVKLHDSYKLAVIIWRPFRYCIKCVRKKWNPKASLIDVFATFLLLSNVKLLDVSFQLISVPITLWNMTGHSMPQKYTFSNGSMEYLGKEHLPYFVLGVAVISVFTVLPILLLCLYPFRWFQRCLHHCSLSSPSLHTFMDAFQGSYKTSPRDYRHLAAMPFIIRLVNFILFSITLDQFYYTLVAFAFIVFASIQIVCMPHKSMCQNLVSIHFLLIMACITFIVNTNELTAYARENTWYLYHAIVGVLSSIPMLIALVYYIRKSSCFRQVTSTDTVLLSNPPLRNLSSLEVTDEYTPLISES